MFRKLKPGHDEPLWALDRPDKRLCIIEKTESNREISCHLVAEQ
jgi:hypothetical protein